MVDSPLTSITLHTERLHEDAVWQATKRLARQVEQRGGQASFFVFPLRADLAGYDLRPRLDELAQRGHEIAQHTHYYDQGFDGSRGNKRTLLTEENIRRCLQRDHDYLAAAGHPPNGFVSGAWTIHPAVMSWLDEHGYRYDCSFRSYELPYDQPDAAAGGSAQAPFRQGRVLEVPTTGSVRDGLQAELLRRPNGLSVGALRYRLYYLHDYDLLSRRLRWSTWALVRAIAGTRLRTASQLAADLATLVA